MARKLKTYTTSAGFFDLAIAAPSMKAALEAWGSGNNLFHHGFAKLSDDPEVVAAAMAKPGVVLRRPVGSNVVFAEHAKLPRDFAKAVVRAPAKLATKKRKPATKPVDDRTAREAALAFEREEKRRERQARKEEAAIEKERERLDRLIAVAEAALSDAKQAHQTEIDEIEKVRVALDKKLKEKEARWGKKKEQLERALRKARSPSYLRLL